MSKYTKYIAIGLVILFLVTSLISCGTTVYTKNNSSGKIPPGQAKKMTGSKSARNYAPGHNK